jgi:hypothetical protein
VQPEQVQRLLGRAGTKNLGMADEGELFAKNRFPVMQEEDDNVIR